MHMIHLSVPDYPETSLEGYILDCELTLGQEKKRPAIVVCPGGGYVYCSPREAEPVALRYAARGFHAFVLRYSVGWEARDFAPLKQVSWVIGYLREHAEEWNIDPEQIVTCGFSAGGHLALAAGLMAEHRPNAMILGYPAVTIPNMPGADYMLKLLTGKQEVTDEDAEALNLLSKIDRNAPPAFLAATAEDFLTAWGAMPVAHGYSLADETCADGSSQVLDDAFAQWHELSVKWLRKTFGQPQFVDKSTSRMSAYLEQLGFDLSVQHG